MDDIADIAAARGVRAYRPCDQDIARRANARAAAPGLLDAACAVGALDATTCTDLRVAHATLLDAGLHCTLDRRPRIVVETDAIAVARAAIRAAARSVGLMFSG